MKEGSKERKKETGKERREGEMMGKKEGKKGRKDGRKVSLKERKEEYRRETEGRGREKSTIYLKDLSIKNYDNYSNFHSLSQKTLFLEVI